MYIDLTNKYNTYKYNDGLEFIIFIKDAVSVIIGIFIILETVTIIILILVVRNAVIVIIVIHGVAEAFLVRVHITPEGGDGGGEEAEAEQQHELGHGSVVTPH